VIGESDLSESGFLRSVHVFNRFADGMTAQRCVDMVVSPYGTHPSF
jgi:hypothetical protein